MRLRRRTIALTAEYRLWYAGRRPEGLELDPADVGARLGALLDGRLGPTATAKALRDAADVVDAVAADCLETIARIDAEYGEVFRRAAYISGKYLAPYERLLATRHLLERSRRVAPELRALADRHEKRAGRRWPPPGGLMGPPDVAALQEAGDTRRLLRALDHRDDDIRARAATVLADLRATEAIDPLLGILDGTRPHGAAPGKKLRNAAVEALAAFHEPRVADALVRYAREHLRDHEDGAALAGLVQMKDDRAVELLAQHLRHGYLPTYAAHLLADLGDPRGIAVLRDYISDMEGNRPEAELSRKLHDHKLERARIALARLDPDPAASGDG
ncbi:HEAT repeat-containing protein [Actinomadura madurae]|uniref:HEAT repeat-containing protein n=1 Tax=Actinomadura madurae TaxID=1993 RepID=A0A1I5QT93_9ACTN|nr:HEAT repeat domain-containing protein [Actinomadura madurae]SFP49261.1 HEAT repeat-containing protein [Actinomadura madurae]